MNRPTLIIELRRSRGFTLAELMIVTLILAITAAIAVPKFSDALDKFRAEAAATRIKADLQLARRHARTISASQQVLFNSGVGTYSLPGIANLDHAGLDYAVDLGCAPYSSVIASATFGGDETLVFDGYGVPDSNGTVTVSSGAYSRVVTLSTSGTVTIQ